MKLEDILLIMDMEEVYDEDSEFYRKPEIDLDDWRHVDTELLEYDLERMYTTETIILYQKSTEKYYAVDLVFVSEEGYTVEGNGEILPLLEAEPYEITVTKYALKPLDELHSQSTEKDLGRSISASYTQTAEIPD